MKARPALSRSGRTNSLGKLTAEIPKFKIPEATKDILDSLAREGNMNLSEFCRDVLMVRAHGVDELLMIEKSRLALVVGNGLERGGE